MLTLFIVTMQTNYTKNNNQRVFQTYKSDCWQSTFQHYTLSPKNTDFTVKSTRMLVACQLKSCFYLNEVQGLKMMFRMVSIMLHWHGKSLDICCKSMIIGVHKCGCGNDKISPPPPTPNTKISCMTLCIPPHSGHKPLDVRY